MTLEEYLQNQGYRYIQGASGDDATRSGWARTIGSGEDSYNQFLEGDNEQDAIRGYQYAQQQLAQPQVQPQPTPQAPTPQTPQPVALPNPRSLDEYLQQQGYEYRPDQGVEGGYQGGWGKYRDDGEGGRIFDPLESHVTNQYYQDPTRFTATRESQVGQGINTFNEGNANQKQVIDQINSGQLYIAPKYEKGRAEEQGYRESTSYELRDSQTGNVVQNQVIPIDPSKGIYSIGADDPNSSGYFTNIVSTDPKGFVNPIVSEQQSQYNSHANSSLNFIKDSVKGLLQMAAIAATAGGAGAALGSATGLGTTGGNIALNTGINALKQGIDGQFNPLGLATSAALSYGLGGAGGEGADPLTADDMYTGQAMTNLASSDDATRLADLVRAFENPTELTGPTIDVADRVSIENPSVIDSQAPVMPSNLQDTAYLDPGLIDVAPENVTIGTPDATPYFDASPTFPTLDVSPEYDPSAYLPTNLGGTQDLGGFDNIPSNLGTNLGGGIPTDLGGLDVPFDTTGMDIGFKNPDLNAGELTVTGEKPYVPFEENFPLPYEPFEEDFPLQTETTETTTETTPVTKPKLLSNILKSTPSALPKAIATQQQSNLANILRGSQMPQTALPPIYKQANPFNFGQQASPVQDVSALAKLLRTA